jgi:hypothetical protein
MNNSSSKTGKAALVLEDGSTFLGYTIRRLAVEYNIPVVTNLQLGSALTKLLEQRGATKFDIRSLNEYMDSLPRNFW